MNKSLIFKHLGRIDYEEAWKVQERLLQENIMVKKINRANGNNNPTKNHLLFVEHPHVYTLGKSGNSQNLLANHDKLEEINATFVKTNRGGDITYHGPGQLVGYPIIDLENFKTDIHWYLRSLEEVIINTIANYGLKGERSKGETGVWLDVGKPYARKICAMGVRMSRWISMHGFALNMNTDLRYFGYIVPCGIKDKAVTSMQQELQKEINEQEIMEKVVEEFVNVFQINIIQ